MNAAVQQWGFLRDLTWDHLGLAILVLVGCRVLVVAMRRFVRYISERAPGHRRLLIWRLAPVMRLLIWFAGIVAIVPLLVQPTFEDVVALIATISFALAFALKDYASSMIAGIVAIIENTYQLGDWIEIDGAYGEVTAINTRAVHIVTADDTKVIIPHARIWSTGVFNASSGQRSLLCVAHIYLQADHDAAAVCKSLIEAGETSRYRKAETPVNVVAAETPWGTHYKIKAYVIDSREQFAMITDLTIRGKERLRKMGVAFAQAPYAENRAG